MQGGFSTGCPGGFGVTGLWSWRHISGDFFSMGLIIGGLYRGFCPKGFSLGIQTRDERKVTEYKTVRNAAKCETIKLTQLEQKKISIECKSNPKKLWQYINRKTRSKANISDLKCKMLAEILEMQR